MRRLAVAFAVAAMLVSTPTVSAEFGYIDTGFDPQDRPDPTAITDRDPDVRSTTRRVYVDRDGRRRLSITFRTYDLLGLGPWVMYVSIDSERGHRRDFRMEMKSGERGYVCRLHDRRSGETREGRMWVPMWKDLATCIVPLGWIDRDKRIRWKLHSPPGFLGTEPGIDEFAPENGWYV